MDQRMRDFIAKVNIRRRRRAKRRRSRRGRKSSSISKYVLHKCEVTQGNWVEQDGIAR